MMDIGFMMQAFSDMSANNGACDTKGKDVGIRSGLVDCLASANSADLGSRFVDMVRQLLQQPGVVRRMDGLLEEKMSDNGTASMVTHHPWLKEIVSAEASEPMEGMMPTTETETLNSLLQSIADDAGEGMEVTENKVAALLQQIFNETSAQGVPIDDDNLSAPLGMSNIPDNRIEPDDRTIKKDDDTTEQEQISHVDAVEAKFASPRADSVIDEATASQAEFVSNEQRNHETAGSVYRRQTARAISVAVDSNVNRHRHNGSVLKDATKTGPDPSVVQTAANTSSYAGVADLDSERIYNGQANGSSVSSSGGDTLNLYQERLIAARQGDASTLDFSMGAKDQDLSENPLHRQKVHTAPLVSVDSEDTETSRQSPGDRSVRSILLSSSAEIEDTETLRQSPGDRVVRSVPLSFSAEIEDTQTLRQSPGDRVVRSVPLSSSAEIEDTETLRQSPGDRVVRSVALSSSAAIDDTETLRQSPGDRVVRSVALSSSAVIDDAETLRQSPGERVVLSVALSSSAAIDDTETLRQSPGDRVVRSVPLSSSAAIDDTETIRQSPGDRVVRSVPLSSFAAIDDAEALRHSHAERGVRFVPDSFSKIVNGESSRSSTPWRDLPANSASPIAATTGPGEQLLTNRRDALSGTDSSANAVGEYKNGLSSSPRVVSPVSDTSANADHADLERPSITARDRASQSVSTFGTRDGQLDKPIATQQNGAKDAASSTYARDTNGERQGTERQRAFSGLRSVQPEPTVQDKKSNGVTDIEDVRSALPNTAPTGEKPVVKAFVSTLASQTALDSGTDRAVMEQIVEKAVFRNVNGQSEMRIQLKPETLGEVRLSITSVNDKVAVQMIADRTATKDIIESQLHHLKAEFDRQGLLVEKIEVTVNTHTDQNSNRDTFSQMQRNGSNESNKNGFGNGGQRQSREETRDEHPQQKRSRRANADRFSYFA